MSIPIFLIKFNNKNKRDPTLSELTTNQKLQLIKCNLYCEDRIKDLRKTQEVLSSIIKDYSKQIENLKPLVDEIVKEYYDL